MTPQVQEAEVEEMPMTYSLEKSSFGLLLEPEGRSTTLLTSIALASIILAGTFLIVMETGRTAKTPVATQANAPSAATSAAPVLKQVAELKTVDLEAKPTQGPVASTAASTPPARAVSAPAKAAVITLAAAAHTKVPPVPATKSAPQQLTAQLNKPGSPSVARPAAQVSKSAEVATAKHSAKSSKVAAAAKPQSNSEPSLMTIMPDPPSQVEHHASVSVPVTAPPATTAEVKSARLPAQKSKKQVAATGVGERIQPISGAAKTKGSIETVGIPATAGTGLVGTRGAVGSTGLATATVTVTQAEASKKVASTGIPGQTRLTIASKRPVAPAPANLDMLSRRSTVSSKQNN